MNYDIPLDQLTDKELLWRHKRIAQELERAQRRVIKSIAHATKKQLQNERNGWRDRFLDSAAEISKRNTQEAERIENEIVETIGRRLE